MNKEEPKRCLECGKSTCAKYFQYCCKCDLPCGKCKNDPKGVE
jgi:hypothetical protein